MAEAATLAGRLEVRRLGVVPYDEAVRLQQDLAARRGAGEIADTLLLLQHPPVFTVGRDARELHVRVPLAALPGLGVTLVESNRGGDITYHGPGQLVGYPILDLRGHRLDVRWYVATLERVLVTALARLGIAAMPAAGLRGVWVGERKIAAVGIHVGRWITTHGFALNVTNDLRPFDLIVPCGIAGRGVTSVAQERPDLDPAPLLDRAAREVELSFRAALGTEELGA